MKRKVIRNFFVVVLVLLEITSIFLMYESIKNKPTILDSVKLKEEINSNNFALMIEENGEYVSSDTFPTIGYVLNETLSGCVDNNGNTLENALTYTDGTIKLKTRTNAMCYLYFDEDNRATTYLINNVSSNILWDSTLEDDGYRYVGTDPDNYICFGTTDSDTCTSNTDLYMYRIIGIFEDSSGEQHLKLIKKTALNENYYWNSSNVDINWNESDLYKGLNGISGGYYNNLFIGSDTYSYMQDSTWLNKIVEWNYTATNTKTIESSGIDYYSETIQNIYLHELNRSSKTSTIGEWKTFKGKISLMYVSDFLISYGRGGLNYSQGDLDDDFELFWLHIINNDSEEWIEFTMTKYGLTGDYYGVWYVDNNVGADYGFAIDTYAVRPVFYLESDIELTGEGTTTNPYIIAS